MADEKHDADDADGKHESGMARRGYSICKRAESEIGARCNIHVRQQLR